MLNETFINEDWKDITGYEGMYQVSNCGRVKSLDRIVKGGYSGSYVRKGALKKQSADEEGYLNICLYKDGKPNMFRVHRLVAEAFIPNPENLPQVNHKDGDKLNNNVENLEWCNNSQNQKHACQFGLRKTKLSKDDKEFICKSYIPRDREFGTRGLARKFNVAQSSIRQVLKER